MPGTLQWMTSFLAKTHVCTKSFNSSSVTREATQLHEVMVLVIFENEGLNRKVLPVEDYVVKPVIDSEVRPINMQCVKLEDSVVLCRYIIGVLKGDQWYMAGYCFIG